MTQTKPLPGFEKLKELLTYEPESGLFFWAMNISQAKKAGDLAGHKTTHGYVVVGIGRSNFMAHRLAWKLTHSVDPFGNIDHINGDRSDNRIQNLRDVSPAINAQNQKSATARNVAGFLGVSLRKDGRYSARITVNRKTKTIGYFKNPTDAYAAYIQAKRATHQGCSI